MDILYTTSNAIRSAIGIDENDLSDEIVGGQFLDLLMQERLFSVLPDHEAASDDDAVLGRLKLWSTYYCAWTLITNAALGIPQKIQANTDSLQRFNIDFEKLALHLQAAWMRMEAMLNPSQSLSVPITIFGKASPAYDPIKGPVK